MQTFSISIGSGTAFISQLLKLRIFVMISFKAHKIKPVEILSKTHATGKYNNSIAYIAKLDINSQKDLDTLVKLHQKWKQIITEDVCNNFIAKQNGRSFFEYDDYFILTKQDKDFNNLDEDKILGILQAVRLYLKKDIKIENLQVNPNTNFDSSTRNYKQVGHQLIEYIKTRFQGRKIYLQANRNAIPFYEKHGFKRIGDSTKMEYN